MEERERVCEKEEGNLGGIMVLLYIIVGWPLVVIN